ncbi:conserved domain protein [Haemophilus pittmaniae HK 85]|uniref:Conserved domain protein n=1 Tax=Haemophilus pittmaniae HK 85 TaxID=1035188 RepID=F9Q9R4_9PAST|nr:conserved domain protein [Haemophilus pittmaniae HK 85]
MAERLSPAQIHLRTISAAVAHAAKTEDLSEFTEYEKMCRLLARHRKDLKQIQSTERKAAYKNKFWWITCHGLKVHYLPAPANKTMS